MRLTTKVSALLLALTVYHNQANCAEPDKTIVVTQQKAAGANAEKTEIRQKLQAALNFGEPYASWAREALSLSMNTQVDARSALKYYNDKVSQHLSSPSAAIELGKKLEASEKKLQQVTKELDQLRAHPMAPPLGSAVDRATVNQTISIASNQQLLKVLHEAIQGLKELQDGQQNDIAKELEAQFANQIKIINLEIQKTKRSAPQSGGVPTGNPQILSKSTASPTLSSDSSSSAALASSPLPSLSASTTKPIIPSKGMSSAPSTPLPAPTPQERIKNILELKLKDVHQKYNDITNPGGEKKFLQYWHYNALILEEMIEKINCLEIDPKEIAKWKSRIDLINSAGESAKTGWENTSKPADKDNIITGLNLFISNVYDALTTALNTCILKGNKLNLVNFGTIVGSKEIKVSSAKKETMSKPEKTMLPTNNVAWIKALVQDIRSKGSQEILNKLVGEPYLINLMAKGTNPEKEYANKYLQIIKDYFKDYLAQQANGKKDNTLNLKVKKLVDVKLIPELANLTKPGLSTEDQNEVYGKFITKLINPYIYWELCFDLKGYLVTYIDNERNQIAEEVRKAKEKIDHPVGQIPQAQEKDKIKWQQYIDKLTNFNNFLEWLQKDLNRADNILTILQQQFDTDFKTLYGKDAKDFRS